MHIFCKWKYIPRIICVLFIRISSLVPTLHVGDWLHGHDYIATYSLDMFYVHIVHIYPDETETRFYSVKIHWVHRVSTNLLAQTLEVKGDNPLHDLSLKVKTVNTFYEKIGHHLLWIYMYDSIRYLQKIWHCHSLLNYFK